MRRSARTTAGLTAVGLCLPLSLLGCSSGTTSTSSANASTTTTAAAAPVNNGAAVTISEYAYTAPEVTIKAGQTVTWTNGGSAKHTVTAEGTPQDFKSPTLEPGAAPFVQSFTNPGTYEYFCSVHGKAKMSGKIIVT